MTTLDDLLDTTALTIKELNDKIRECVLSGNSAEASQWAEALRDTVAAYEDLAEIED